MAFCPLITICGTTGVGKSKFAIELALKLSNSSSNRRWQGARIINADSMQVYAGMDVITNKVSESEMQGIDHLLMGFKKPGEQYFVSQWILDAMNAIDETHSKNQIPIVVGGTSYWIQHLMFPNRLARSENTSKSLSSAVSGNLAQSLSGLPPQLLDLYNALPEYAEPASADPEAAVQLHALLSALDPTVAVRWHWKDTRKVLRSLRIMRDTGRKPSEIINEQSQISLRPRYRTLCFWLHAEPSVLHQRLDARVDEMIEQGLLNEILALRKIAASQSSTSALAGQTESRSSDSENLTTDYTMGIYQSIGYKEFHSYLASTQPADKAFSEAIENMKQSTRKYAKRQVSWFRNKLLPAVYAANASSDQQIELIAPTYLLDATELGDKWSTGVLTLGQQITEAFLANQELPDPKSLSNSAREMLTINDKPTDPNAVLNARRRTICSVCTTDSQQPVMIEEGREWELHQKSRTHRKLVNRAIRQESGHQRHLTAAGTKGQRTANKNAWQDLDEPVMSIFP